MTGAHRNRHLTCSPSSTSAFNTDWRWYCFSTVLPCFVAQRWIGLPCPRVCTIRNFVIGDRGAAVMYAVAYDDGLPDELRLSGISRSSKAFKAAVDEEYFLHRPAAAEAEVWHFFPEEEENEQEQDEEEDLEEALEEEEELEEQEQQEEQEHEEEH